MEAGPSKIVTSTRAAAEEARSETSPAKSRAAFSAKPRNGAQVQIPAFSDERCASSIKGIEAQHGYPDRKTDAAEGLGGLCRRLDA